MTSRKNYKENECKKCKKETDELMYGHKCPECYRESQRAYYHEVRKLNPQYKIADKIRGQNKRVWEIKDVELQSDYLKSIGCASVGEFRLNMFKSMLQFAEYIPDGFIVSKNSKRPEGWDMDHIIPLSSFDLTDPVQYKKAIHIDNLRLIPRTLHKHKYNKIIKNITK